MCIKISVNIINFNYLFNNLTSFKINIIFGEGLFKVCQYITNRELLDDIIIIHDPTNL